MKNLVHTGWLRVRKNHIFLCTMWNVPEERTASFCGKKLTGYCTDTIQCNAIQCNENKIPLQGQCLCSLCLVCLSSEKDLNLVYYLIPMWNSSMKPSGHMGLKSYFYVFLFFLFLCILTGVATITHQVIMASDYQNQKACKSSFIKPCHARRLVSWWHIHCWQWVCQNY